MIFKSLLSAVALTVAIASLATPVAAQTGTSDAPGAIKTLGCYTKPDSDVLQVFGDWTYQTDGYCQGNCTSLNEPVMAITGGTTCYCGSMIPAADTEVDPSNCNSPCAGFGEAFCGGIGYWQVYLTGLTGNVEIQPNKTTSSTSSSSSGTSTSTPAEQATVTFTASASATAEPSSSGGPNKVGIAVGVVVGVIALAAGIGAFVLYRKRQQNREIEDEHRRNAAVTSFVAGSDKATMDSRLDPSFTTRRTSFGSIADERDFSRRILQVRNPDRDSKASAVA